MSVSEIPIGTYGWSVLQFFNEAGDVVSVRPSGTEPKIKFYFGAKGDDASAKIEALKAQFIS